MEAVSIVHEHNYENPCDYKILFEEWSSYVSAVKYLEQSVKEYISQGWIPQGGISITLSGSNHYCLSQAMIKISKE